jgi:7-cyano-7-deazaguanine tRNA-ribosyltransferase
LSFEVKDRAAAGRIGRLETRHGSVTTPTLLPVINPNLPVVPPADMKRLFGAEMVITNSYIIRKSDALRERALRDGVHKTIGWDGPVMTDSGTFQAYFYNKPIEVAPLEIVEFQRRIGVDVGTILDVFTTPDRTREEALAELAETMRRAKEAVAAKDGMMLAATVQGGLHVDVRAKSAREVGALDVDLVPIGGVVPLMEQARYAELTRIILAAKQNLPSGRPVHLFGAGHPLVFPFAAALGCDLFDSASYAKFAKDGRLIFPNGTRSLDELEELPCVCPECERWKNASELRRASAAEREGALARHNLHVSFGEIRRIRQAIRDGALWELVEERAAQNPALLDALRVLRGDEECSWLETLEPSSGPRGFQYRGSHSLHRPGVARLHVRLLTRWRPRSKTCIVLPERTKPYGESYAPYLAAFAKSGHDFVVETPFGPVPLEFERLYPVAQSVFPETLDADGRAVRDAFASRFFARFDGCDVLPVDLSEHEALPPEQCSLTPDAFEHRRAFALAEYQYGAGAGKALFQGTLTFKRSPGTGAVRNLFVEGEHVASLRARDGLLSLRIEGSRRLVRGLEAPRARIALEDEPAKFVREGKNVMAKFVASADVSLRPGDDAAVVDSRDGVVGVGRCMLSGHEMRQFSRGLAAKNTEHAKDD